MENEVVEPAAAPVEAVVADVEKAALDIHALCDEAMAGLQAIYERVKDHPDAKGLRSTLAFAVGRFEAEKQQFWQ